MSTFIVAVTSADGFIANEDHVRSFEWNSKADKDSFIHLTRDAGIVVMGSKTFETFARNGEQPKPLPGRLNIVYSRSKKYEGKNLETIDKKPFDLVKDLIVRGVRDKYGRGNIAVIGGAEIYRMFIEANEIDRIYLTIEPVKFGHGIPFWQDGWKKKFQLDKKSEHKINGTKFQVYNRKNGTSK
jgi:dihydrofolate reductase